MTQYSGIWPVAPTPFHDDGTVDIEGMKRVLDCLIDQGADGICILANFSEQFLISDAEREMLARTSTCLLYTSPSPRDRTRSRMPSSA